MSFEQQEIRELRLRAAKLERMVAFLLEQLKLNYVDKVATDADPEVMALLAKGKTIDAIKLYREKTGADLVEAKRFIDALNK